MRTYEITFILKPDLTEEETDGLVSQMESIVTSTGGTVEKIERVGRRRLAYQVERYTEGLYVFFALQCEVPTVQEFERRLKVSDQVIKFLTVRTDEEQKRLEKIQGERTKRLARKKRRPGAEPSASPA